MNREQATARRRRRSGGSVIVESAFTLLPTFALIFGMLDFGLMLFRWSTLQNAVREGARYAITFQRATGLGQDASIKQVVERYAMGMVKTTDSPQHIFVNYFTQQAPNTAVNPGGNVPNNIVEVSVQNVTFSWLAPISGGLNWSGALRSTTPLTFKVYSSDILGGFPVGVGAVPR